MSRHAATQASRMASRALRSSTTLCRSPLASRLAPAASIALAPRAAVSLRSFFSTSPAREKGIMPDTENPAKATPEPETTGFAVVELSDAEYHELADEYLDNVVGRFEELQDSREDIDVEFSAGVLTISFPDQGTYVINKQPPNKQIWLSSPISGPKRYDWCLMGEGQGDKEDTAEGDWIYGRDGSSLSDVFLQELGVDVNLPTNE
ncbi:hypothetical protein BGZ61DRAFT_223131 [Ilyonectria robusta]|uniref:uncharacterized protein n=1 Tax=Ilyonectria robusta TaxID=1079257 RepID=UPI001E8D95D1|nr:uncharacterized protein BGZ61DRAFT_223131 [Ilyonectria robusta]KAH8706546.1 hypothetical protein BGZ61DRAFT_223131 [Ilyonectria robusta]